MTHYTKHLSFLFTVPIEFFNSCVKVTTQYEVMVRFTLNYKGEVHLQDYNLKPGMAVHIINWEGLEKEMLVAAENNSKQYRPPNGRSYFKQLPQPGEDAYWDACMEMNNHYK